MRIVEEFAYISHDDPNLPAMLFFWNFSAAGRKMSWGCKTGYVIKQLAIKPSTLWTRIFSVSERHAIKFEF